MRRTRTLAGATMVVGALLLASGPGTAQDAGGRIITLRLDGVVDPFVASYVEDGLGDAADDPNATAVLITIDTPGGLDSSMRQIVQAILASDVPVLCLVSPEGARAASAGTFVLLSCPVAAMAPATNVGAAHPVGLSGAIASEKATNDAAALLVSLAERFDRNAQWAERAVRESESASAEEALDLGVIDLIATSEVELLAAVDGRTVTLGQGREVTLATAGATLESRELGWGAGLLHDLLDPNIAFIFFYLGLALVIAELFVPGLVLGLTGGFMLILAVVALGMLPVQIVGVVGLVASLAFFALELKHPGLGLPSIAGVLALILGGLFLFDPAVPSARVSPWTLVPTAALATVFFTVVLQAAIKMRRKPSPSAPGANALGQVATVIRDLDPNGIVHVASEEWSADLADPSGPPAPAGSKVRVVSMKGLRLVVEPEVVQESVPAVRSGPPTGETVGGGERKGEPS